MSTRTPLIAAALLVLAPAVAGAQGWIEPVPGVDDVVKLRTRVVATVRDGVASVEVQEWFENRGPGPGEGDYLHPLPGEAVFSSFSLYQGDRELRGETMDADEARAIYREIVRKRRDPALIELAGHGLLRARVFPIEPGGTRKITLRYTLLLERAGDAHHFRYAAGGPSGPTVSGDDPRTVRSGVGSAPVDFRIVVEDGEAYGEPFSPTHGVDAERRDGRLVVRPDSELAGDFSLFLPFADDRVGITVATHRVSGDDGYFMLTLSPGPADGEVQPRDVVAVVDVSGSMAGEKIAQARAALRQLVGTLDRRDRFRLIAFSNGVRTHAPGWSRVTAASRAAAREWIDGLVADGGTNIAGALDEALRTESPGDRLPVVVFLTDGLPSVGERDPERIAARAGARRGRARIFAFGVGYDVNTHLLDRLGAEGRGSTEYVEPGEDVEATLSALARKIRRPVLTDLEIAGAPVELREVHPRRLPDLFAGEELVVFGRYRAGDGDRGGTLRITGRRGGGAEGYSTEVTFPVHRRADDYIPRLWASRKLGALVRTLRLEGRRPELVEEIRRTALRYGLVSEETAYLVVEPGAVARAGEPGRRPLPSTPIARDAMAASGKAAVRVAEEARRRRELRTAPELAEAEADLLASAVGTSGVAATGDRRVVAGRVFVRRDGAWTDALHREDGHVVEIEAYSDAYFEVLDALPELEAYWSRFEEVVVAGEAVSVRLSVRGGRTSLGPHEVRELVEGFRAG